MRWIDLLRMSSSSLKRRKLRTFLTVLGVVIGTASIVVMISLGLGMQESLYREIEQSGGVTSIVVTGMQGSGSYYYYYDSETEEPTQYVTDETVQMISQLEHVKTADPVLEVSALMKKGKYIGYIQLQGMSDEALKNLNMELAPGGRLPDPNSAELELGFGNGVIMDFYEEKTGKGSWESGELPDIDMANDQMFLILDQDGYYSSQNASMGMGSSSDSSGGQNTSSNKPVKKHVVQASGVVAGDPMSYNPNSYYVYCNLDKLVESLKKEFRGRVIPGQPSTQSGKPYKKFVYSSLKVQADSLENVEDLSTEIRSLGYNVTTNAEYMDSMKKQFAMIQAVLGGIGAVSLFVAAIGIANTMMMSIYERTKEIGVIKVLGCSLKNIRQMFLLEAAFIGFIGGLVGNLLSFLMSFIINVLTQNGSAMGMDGNISYIPVWLVLVSMGFAVFVGMAAGYFPALRAMRLSPLAAIHNE